MSLVENHPAVRRRSPVLQGPTLSDDETKVPSHLGRYWRQFTDGFFWGMGVGCAVLVFIEILGPAQ